MPRKKEVTDVEEDADKKKFPLLDSITSVFSLRDIERKRRLEVEKVKEETSKVHVQFIRDNLLSNSDFERAGAVVSEWAKKNGRINIEKLKTLKIKRKVDQIPLSAATLKRRRDGTPAISHHTERHVLGSLSNNNTQTTLPDLRSCSNIDRSTADTRQTSHTEDILDLREDLSVFRCPVINCGISYKSQTVFDSHTKSFFHPPCNPYINLVNGTLPNLPILYSCPKCEETFYKKIDCQEHMIFEDHLPVLSPISICGYMCPQCCMIYNSIVTCHTHMTNNDHHDVTYAFAGDSEERITRSIPISFYLANQFYLKCMRRLYGVKCVQCIFEVKTYEEQYEHVENTDHKLFISLSASSPEEVFAEFLTDKVCSTCGKVVWEGDVEKGFHACDSTQIGWLVDNDCQTMKEFVRRCSITQENEHHSVILLDTDNSDSNPIIIDSEPSVSTWQGQEKVKPNRSPTCTSTTHTITRSSSPNKRIIQVSKQTTQSFIITTPDCTTTGISTNNQSPSRYSDQNPSLSSSPETSHIKEPAQNVFNASNEIQEISQPSFGKLSRKARRKLKRKRIEEMANASTRNKPEVTLPAIPCSDTLDKLSKTMRKNESINNSGNLSGMPSVSNICDTDGDISTKNLSKMHLLIFLDLDNWPIFFKRLPHCLPDKTFVWTFYGGNTVWKQPKSLPFLKLKKAKCFHLHHRCGKTKDAADFAICFTIGQMDDRLPKSVPFAILSGDRGFCEIERQMKNSSRRTVVIDPHEAERHSADMIYTMILSVMTS